MTVDPRPSDLETPLMLIPGAVPVPYVPVCDVHRFVNACTVLNRETETS